MSEKRKTDGEDQNSHKVAKLGEYKTNESFKLLLINSPVESLAYRKQGGVVFFVDRTDKMSDTFKGLMQHNFLSVPVLQKTKHKWYGFVDVSDFVHFYVEHFGAQLGDEGKQFWETVAQKEGFLEKTVTEIMKNPRARSSPFRPVTVGYSLFHAIEILGREEGVLRVPIIDRDRNLKSVLTQSQVVEFLYENINILGSIKNKKVSEFHGVLKPVHTVNETVKAIDAFSIMQKENIYAIAIVNDDGKIVDNLSLRDLKGLRLENQLFHRLFQTVHNYLRHLRQEFKGDRPKSKQVVDDNDNLEEVLKILTTHNIHQVYIVDQSHKPRGVITLKDVIYQIISN